MKGDNNPQRLVWEDWPSRWEEEREKGLALCSPNPNFTDKEIGAQSMAIPGHQEHS